MKFILDRLNADFGSVGLGQVALVPAPEENWVGPVWEFEGTRTACGFDDPEAAVATLAWSFQDKVVDDKHEAWPQVDGRPLWPSAESGVACWCLDGKPWCAIGDLVAALAALGDVSE